MPNIKAQATGNWSATATWAGGVVPVAGDVVYFNGFTVTLDQNASVALLTTAAGSGMTFNGGSTTSNAGGGLTINAARTLTADITVGTTTVVSISVGGVTINAATSAGFVGSSTTGSTYAINMTHTTGTNTITGNCTGGVVASAFAIQCGSGAWNLVGNVTALNVGSGTGGVVTSGSTLCNITGNLTGGGPSAGNSYAVVQNQPGTINVTGSLFGGSSSTSPGLVLRLVGITCVVNGNIVGGNVQQAYGMQVQSFSNTVIINGNATGGTGSGGPNTFASGADGISTASSITLNGAAIGNGFGATSTGIAGPAFGVSTTNQAAVISLKKIQYGALGASPTAGQVAIIDEPSNNTAQFYRISGGPKTLSDPSAVAGTYPATTDVRSGVTYANGNNTGTCAVPSPSNVDFGTPVGSTTGTAVLSIASVQAALTSQGITTTRAARLDNLDATVSSRLAASGYTAPDNASVTAIKAKTDALPASPAPAGDTTGLTAYGASKLTTADITNAVIPLV